ncbi:SLATT domain-containing protein [Mycolicibacterium farcinogenes]|uniref:SLATT domain-containing protein n=1 Tax=Mycolicibacterium farcinogenes TaxID=1802 RepID=A0ACD1FCE1_MYCFR|nr:SLATT domain-containing protein [Mycolicibacterium farcinogenes]QZH64722.1 SLATT domain-containing protein [Mycolicibacterium farcinogenes]
MQLVTRLRGVCGQHLRFVGLLVVLRLLLLNEEEEEEVQGDYGSAARNPPKPIKVTNAYDSRYLGIIDDAIIRHSHLAARIRARYLAFVSLSITSAAAVPVVVSADLPGWVAALLGAVTAAAQGIQQVLQDGRLATAHHTSARRLSDARRRLLADLRKGDEDVAFERFVDRCEDAMETDTEIFASALERLGREGLPAKVPAPESNPGTSSRHT